MKWILAIIVATATCTLLNAANAAPANPELAQLRASNKAKAQELKTIRAQQRAAKDEAALAKARERAAKLEMQLATAPRAR